MDFELSDEQRAVQQMAREFARREIAPKVAEYDREERYPMEIVRQMGELGMLGGVLPPEYGGAGMDYMSWTLLIEEISKVCQTMGSAVSSASGLRGAAILKYGTEEQKRKYLVPLCRGEVVAGAGITEPRSGSDVGGMQTTVVKKGDEYIINGAKMWISGVEVGSWFLTFATLDRSLGRNGICAFIVESGFPGFHHRAIKNKLGFRATTTGELVFQDCRVPAKNLVAAEGEGLRVAMAALEDGRLGVAARALGVMEACLEESVRYANERIVGGQPIGRYQLVQSKITDMVVGIESSRYLIYHLAWMKDQGISRARREASLAKMHATDSLMKVATDACQIHGAYACSDEYNVGRYFRDAKFFQVVEGTSEIHRVLIAEYALGYRSDAPRPAAGHEAAPVPVPGRAG